MGCGERTQIVRRKSAGARAARDAVASDANVR